MGGVLVLNLFDLKNADELKDVQSTCLKVYGNFIGDVEEALYNSIKGKSRSTLKYSLAAIFCVAMIGTMLLNNNKQGYLIYHNEVPLGVVDTLDVVNNVNVENDEVIIKVLNRPVYYDKNTAKVLEDEQAVLNAVEEVESVGAENVDIQQNNTVMNSIFAQTYIPEKTESITTTAPIVEIDETVEETQPYFYVNPELNQFDDTKEIMFENNDNANNNLSMIEDYSAIIEEQESAESEQLIPDYSVLDTNNVDTVPEVIVDVSNEDTVDAIDLLNAPVDEAPVKAYAVYIDDAYIGAVTDVTIIENALNELKAPYQGTEGLVSLSFDKNITYDKEIEMQANMLTDSQAVVDKILSTEGVARYYEVVPGDCPSIIADKLGLTTAEVCSLPVTFNGEIVEDISSDCRVGMQIQYQAERKFIHVLVEKDVVQSEMTAFETEVIEDDTMFKGTQEVVSSGEYGELQRVVRVVVNDNEIVSQELISETVVKQPVKEVIHVGTRDTITAVNTNINAGGSGDYFWPVGDNGGYISAYFGDGRGHKGIDIAAPYGTSIYAAHSGTISKTNTSGWGGGYGNHVMIAGDDGYDTMYAHMSYVADGISVGTYVVEGQLIGYVGSTGDSTGNHCHFEVRYNGSYLNPINFVGK